MSDDTNAYLAGYICEYIYVLDTIFIRKMERKIHAISSLGNKRSLQNG